MATLAAHEAGVVTELDGGCATNPTTTKQSTARALQNRRAMNVLFSLGSNVQADACTEGALAEEPF